MTAAFLAALCMAGAPQSRWEPPFEVLEQPRDIEKYARRMDATGKNVFIDGELLTIVFRSKEGTVGSFNSLNIALKRAGESDLWFAQATMDRWDDVFFSYAIVDGGIKSGQRLDVQFFRGRNGPREPEKAKELKGTVETHTIQSDALGEDRQVTVYIPPGGHKGLPAVYMADGERCKSYAEILEPLILKGKVRPLALVGVHAGGYRGKPGEYQPEEDYRAKEYLKMVDADRYAKHLVFFCDEVVSWAERKFALSSKRQDRAVNGFSNGGAFAATAAADHPEVFGAAMAYSVAAFDRDDLRAAVKDKKLPAFYFSAGDLEVFVRGTKAAFEIATEAGATATIESYRSGHDPTMWMIAFLRDVQAAFPSNKVETVPLRNERFKWPGIGQGDPQDRPLRGHRPAPAQGPRQAGALRPRSSAAR